MYKGKKILAIIPARGGSKGLAGKNIKPLLGKPLICYTIDVARQFLDDKDICVSTDNLDIKKLVESFGLNVPFIRPDHLATDISATGSVVSHALDYYESIAEIYDIVIILQPTSPLRTLNNIIEAFDIYINSSADMLVSVVESKVGPVLCKDNNDGNVQLIFNSSGMRRQDLDKLYEYNGAIYIVSTNALKNNALHSIDKRKKYVMSKYESVDIDDIYDFKYVEVLMMNE